MVFAREPLVGSGFYWPRFDRQAQSRFVMAALWALLFTGLLRAGADLYSPTIAPTTSYTNVSAHSTAVTTPAPATTASQPQTQPNPVTAAVVSPSPAACAPAGTASAPGALDLSNASSGLTQIVDAPTNYIIHGYTTTQQRAQMHACAPSGADFSAYTGYRLSWLYNYSAAGNGQCALTNIKLGLHVNQVLPAWQQAGATNDVASHWQSFASSLTAHENGHTAIDINYASKLLYSLQTLGSVDCSSIGQTVNAAIQSGAAAMDQANADYDAQTSHGATQGAVL